MRIQFRKLTDERHELQVVHESGATETMECETRSFLVHDLLHFAVEAEAGLDGGFWGSLAAGRTLDELNDHTLPPADHAPPDLMMAERIVGALSGAVKGRSAEQVLDGLRGYAAALEWTLPDWLTPDFVAAVQGRMRRLLGHWRATTFGETMELSWPAPSGPAPTSR